MPAKQRTTPERYGTDTPAVDRAAEGEHRPITLWLPEPPSVNKNRKQANKYSAARERNFYKAQVWAEACRQRRPRFDPPAYVRIDAELRLFSVRDTDNAWGSLKWVIDALKLRQKRETFRHGLYIGRGYFVDDDPAHIGLVPPVQTIDRGGRGLLLTVTPCEPGSVLTYQELEAEIARMRASDIWQEEAA